MNTIEKNLPLHSPSTGRSRPGSAGALWTGALVASLLTSLAPLVTAADAAPAGGAVELKLKWPVGNRYVMRTETKIDNDMQMPNAPQTMKQGTTLSQDFSYTVTGDRPNGGRTVEMEFLAMAMESKMGDTVMMRFDSKDSAKPSPDNPALAGLSSIVGTKMTFQADAKGQFEKVENYQAFIDKVAGGPGPGTSMFKSMFNEENLKRMGTSLQNLPDKPVKIGDQWSAQTQFPMGPIGTLTIDLQYKFTGMEDHDGRRCAVLATTGTITGKPASEAMSMTIEKSALSGNVWFDPELGMAVDSAIDQDMTMKMTMQGQTMTLLMKQKTSSKLIEIGKAKK